MPEQFQYLVGIDWATESHEVCVLDSERQILEEKQIEHSGSGIAQLIELLLKRSGGRPELVGIATEAPLRRRAEPWSKRWSNGSSPSTR